MSTAGVFINEMSAVQKSESFFDLESIDGLNAEFQTVLEAMQKLGRIFPIVGASLSLPIPAYLDLLLC